MSGKNGLDITGIALLGAVALGGYFIFKFGKGLADTLGGAAGVIGNTATGVTGVIGNTATGVTGVIGNTATGVTGVIGNTATGVTGVIGNTATGVTGFIGNTATGLVGAIGNAPNAIASGTKEIVNFLTGAPKPPAATTIHTLGYVPSGYAAYVMRGKKILKPR